MSKMLVLLNSSKLTLEAENETTIDGDFEVELGSELEIW